MESNKNQEINGIKEEEGENQALPNKEEEQNIMKKFKLLI